MLRLPLLAFAALLCVQGTAATCCAGKPVECPANETSSYAGDVTFAPVCCADGKWDCQRSGKGTVGSVCKSRGGTDKACPAPAPATPAKCCEGKPIECPPPEDSPFGGVTYTAKCCANGKWECQRNGKGTVGSVCSPVGGTAKACPKPKPEPQCCNGTPKKCPPPEDSPYGGVTYQVKCCANGKWECQRNGKGTVGSVCSPAGGTAKACPKCCKSGPKKCPPDEDSPYGKVTFNPVCCANGKWECQRNGKGTVGSVCSPAGGVSKQCTKCCKAKPKTCPADEDSPNGKVTFKPVCCGDGKQYCQRSGKGTVGSVCATKRGVSKQCPTNYAGNSDGYWL